MADGVNSSGPPAARHGFLVVTAAPHGDAVRQFNEAFSPPGNRPGLFALTEADLETSVKRENRTAVSNSLMTETVRQRLE